MNIAIAKEMGGWGWAVLFNANNQATSWRKITGSRDEMIIFEDFGQYPKRLTLECDSALSAQETFEAMIEVEEKMVCECL